MDPSAHQLGSACQPDAEAGTGIARQAAGAGLAAMKFRDQANYVKSEPEMRPAVGIRAGLPQ